MSQPQQISFGDASGITLLLADHESFGFSERACYHFDLIETLTQTPEESETSQTPNEKTEDTNSSNNSTLVPITTTIYENQPTNTSSLPLLEHFSQPSILSCGVVSLLECTSQAPIKQTKKRKRLMKKIKDFNKNAELTRIKYKQKNQDYCHQPMKYPLHLSFNTRVAFAYELTRMVFCIDASPTLTLTLGNMGTDQQLDDDAICAIDRIESMARLFFNGLMRPIMGVSPLSSSSSSMNQDTLDQQKQNEWWIPEIAITVVACYPQSILPNDDEESFRILVSDYRIHNAKSATTLCNHITDWIYTEVESTIASKFSKTGGRINSFTSSFKQMIETCCACDLQTLPSTGRPCFVIATDCRAVQCNNVLDIVQGQNLKDTPIHILDLSGCKTHKTGVARYAIHENEPGYLTYDHDGPASFSLTLPDDCETLYDVCKSTRGHFFDADLLKQAVDTIAGKVDVDSSFHDDIYFSLKKRTVRPNGLQWYTIFSLSDCCPLSQSWGNIPAPKYIQQRRELTLKHPSKDPVKFLSYNLFPVRVKSLLVMRILDGFRARKYGSNSQDPDKVSIIFTLNLEMGTVIHYELQFKSSRYHNAMVGSANIKISLAGEPSFVQMVHNRYELVKNRYKSNQFAPAKKSILSVKDRTCLQICNFLYWISHEDVLESNICPLDWKDDGSELLKHLHDLTSSHIYRHFRLETFEVVYILESDVDSEDMSAERKLISLISAWSSKTILHGKLFLRQLANAGTHTGGDLTNYCLVEIDRTDIARMFTVNVHFFEQIDTLYRLAIVNSLKETISSNGGTFVIAPRPFSKFIFRRNQFLSSTSAYGTRNLHQYDSWELLNDPELLPLIVKRRSQFDHFCPIVVSSTYIILVKFAVDDSGDLYLVQYIVERLADKVIVSILMDYQKGDFSKAFSHLNISSTNSMYLELREGLMERDKKSTRALRSRRNLLNLIDNESNPLGSIANYSDDVDRLLLYASKFIIKLRFYDEKSEEANKNLEELTVNFMLSGSLNDVTEIPVGNIESFPTPGKWFLIRIDSNILSIVHFSFHQSISEDAACREVTFFTVATTNLYFYQADLNEADTDDRNNQDYRKVSVLGEKIKVAHGRNYSRASYLALRNQSSDCKDTFTCADFQHALSYCVERKITNDVEIKPDLRSKPSVPDTDCNTDCNEESSAEASDTKLTLLIGTVLKPVPVNGSPYFYFYREEDDELLRNEAMIDVEFNRNVDESNDKINLPPLFILFTLDNKPASLKELSLMSSQGSKVSILNAFVTTFKDLESPSQSISSKTKFPKLHTAVSNTLVMRLNSFVAEQTLDRLCLEHTSFKDSDDETLKKCETVKKCLYEGENICNSTIPIHFYFSKIDSMLDASVSVEIEGDYQEGYQFLCQCLSNQNDLKLKELSSGKFFAVDIEKHGWCFVDVPDNGVVLIYVHHPLGNAIAEKVAESAYRVVTDAIHCANQMLLLKHMHKTRIASSLMIPENNAVISRTELSNHDRVQQSSILEYPVGYFQCDISFKESYELNRRCTLTSAILELESSVLHSFALLNRRGIFVYKDEDGLIFYMRLQPCPGNDSKPDSVDFLVYGTQPVGPSITVQLSHLLKKKLMLICVETISLVLTKNPHYNLWPTDIEFINNFETNWRKLVHDDSVSEEREIYAFPTAVYDPVLVLVFFRQNISGSTFFNSISDGDRKVEENPSELLQDSNTNDSGFPFTFNHREFNLCYNATQFQLDPKFQPVSTITEVGKHYSRIAGTGVALIEIKLLDSKMNLVSQTRIGNSPSEEPLHIQMESLRFHKVEADEESNAGYHLSVRIINTTLKTEPLYHWLELTLNQALTSWIIERHLERSRLGLRPFVHWENKRSNNEKIDPINKLCIGLPCLGSILQSSCTLPHPAVKKAEFNGNIRSTEIPKLLFSLLDRMVYTMFDGKKRHINDVNGLNILRLCGSAKPRTVHLCPLAGHQTVHTVDASTNEILLENGAMSPQYISCYGLSYETENIRRDEIDRRKVSPHGIPSSSFLFQKVSIVDDHSSRSDSLSNALSRCMLSTPYAFMRRLATIMVVTRTKTTILFYNWNPQVYETVVARLEDKFSEFNDSPKSITSLKHLDILDCVTLGKHTKKKRDNSTRLQNIEKQGSSGRNVNLVEGVSSNGKKNTSSSILMPTIVGKSVKGSAMQAVAMSRAKARTNAGTRPTTDAKISKYGVSGNLAPRAIQRSTWKAHKKKPNKSNNPSEKGKEVNEILKHVPSNLIKEYVAVQNFIFTLSLKRIRVINLYQKMFLAYLSNLKDKEVPIQAMEFILTHAYFVKTESFLLLQSIVEDPFPFLSYLTKVSLSHDTNITQIAKNFTWAAEKGHKKNVPNPTIYLMKQAASFTKIDLVLVHEVSVISHQSLGKIGRCRSWLFICSNKFNKLPWAKEKEKVIKPYSRYSMSQLEKESKVINNKTNTALTNMNLNGEMFNFISTILRRVVNRQLKSIDIPLLLRETKALFPSQIQTRKGVGKWFRLFYRTVLWDDPTAFSSIHHFFQYVSKRIYNLVDCSKNEMCIGGKVCGDFEDVNFFILPNSVQFRDNKRVTTFDLYVLCFTQGLNLETYFFQKGSHYATKQSQYIVDQAKATVLDLLNKASIECRREQLWTKYSTHEGHSDVFHDDIVRKEIIELFTLGTSTSLGVLDSRLMEILTHEAKELSLNLSKVFTNKNFCKSFNRCISVFSVGKPQMHLFCFGDVFMLIETNAKGEMISGKLLGKDIRTNTSEGSLEKSFVRAIELFGHEILSWIYDHT